MMKANTKGIADTKCLKSKNEHKKIRKQCWEK